MNTRPLFLDDAFKEACRQLREFAERRENWYVLDENLEAPFVPGDRDEYVLRTEFGYRVVFTITHAPSQREQPFRHMTISVPAEGKSPNPVAVFTVAHHLGFTGAKVEDDVATEPGRWALATDWDDECIVVQEPYEVPG